jgi:hypothetical protein
MKTKNSSKKVPTAFLRRIALLGCALLALTIFAPTIAEAELMLSLDNPDQTVAAPLSGTTIVDFTGTVTVDAGFRFNPPGAIDLTPAFNISGTNFLTSSFTSAFVAFVTALSTSTSGGTFTGSIFDVSVPAGTPPDLYAFSLPPLDAPAELFLRVQFDEEPNSDFFVLDFFSVRVTGVSVPDRGSNILLLGLSLAALWSFHALKRVAA